ncbi:MAG: hypothetical protein ACEQSX_04240 [Baekduiaceae bacterium]
MTSLDRLIGEFVDAWNAGRRPDAADYLQRADPADRPELARQLDVWMLAAPTPAFDDDARAAIRAEPALAAALQAAAEQREPLAARMPRLRERAGLAVDDVARRLAALFELSDVTRTTGYLERLEHDDLDERRLSRRLLTGLAAILGVDPDALRPAAAPASALYRADDTSSFTADDLDALSRAALTPAPEEHLDDVDRLFVGGPGA